MSSGGSDTSKVLGVAGAVIGGFFGGPSGAFQGYSIGTSIGNMLDPPKGPTVEGPRLNDLSVQTSTYGQFIPRTYGTIGLYGNIFWLENNKLKEVVKKKKSGGKGGGSYSTVKTYTYYATFAVGLCEGPIAGVRRIWVGPDLVYDAGSDDLETIISSNQASSKFTIYLGTDTQQPDPRMQAEMGVANCPAFRGLAYIVVKDLLLTNYGNSVAGAPVKVEVMNAHNTVQGSVILTGSVGTPYAQPNLECSCASAWMVGDSLESYINITKSQNIYGTGVMQCELVTAIKASRTAVEYINVPGDPVSSFTYPLAGDADGPSYGFGFNSKVLIDGASYAMPYLGYFPGSCRYVKRGDSVWVFALSIPRRITRADTGIYCEDNNVMHITSDGSVLYALLLNGTVDVRDKDTLALIRNDNYGLPVTGWSTGLTGTLDGIMHRDGALYVLRSANRTIYRIDNGAISKTYVLPFTPNGNTNSWGIGNGVVAFLSGATAIITYYQLEEVSPQTVPLSEILGEEFIGSRMITSGDLDTSLITDTVIGYKVSSVGSIRNAIEPLRGAWPFDVVQSGYKIKATSRGSESVVTIPIGELAIDTQLTESREMDSQLPQNVTVKHIDRDRDYDQNEQRAQRDNTEAVNSLVLELPVVLSATQSAQVADKLIRIYALEKSDFSFTLPAPYRYLEPGDVVTIAATDADYVLRLVSVNQTADGRLECAGRPSSAATYTSIATGDGGQAGGATIPLAGATVGLIVDCPVIDEGLQDAPGFAVGMNGYSAGWPGGILYRTADNGQTWDDLQALEGRATAGFAAGVLAASAGNLIQRGGSLTVSLIGGTLESVTEAQMLNGANIAAYGINGRWEILRFQNATLNGDGTYTLDTFWRGDKGTEWATGLHAVNDTFVLMTDPDVAFVGMPTDSIGQPRDYRYITAGADIDSAASQAFTYSGVNLETLSGVHPRGSRSAGDLTITWQRRTRVGGAWRDYVDASLGEASQAYEIDIMQGATVKRTITATTPSVLYTSAMQVTDFGSQQSSVTVNIYQLSAVVGRGYKLEATL